MCVRRLDNIKIDFTEYQRKILGNLGYYGLAQTRIDKKQRKNDYFLRSTYTLPKILYWCYYANTLLKAIFLAFLILDYFGPVVFLDKIAALDYILCVGIVTLGSCIWFLRYPLFEILYAFWKTENSIYNSLGLPEDLKLLVDKRQFATVWIHLIIVWFGCSCLVLQFYADPKYCVFTYSIFELDTWYLRIIFCAHEFFFMLHAWCNMTSSGSLCTFQGIVLANLINRMTEAIEALTQKQVQCRNKRETGKHFMNETTKKRNGGILHHPNLRLNYDIEKLILDYKKLMLISDRFNSWVSYKIVFLHTCGYCQFISDVFVAMQILKMPDTGFADVWFYIEDSLASMYMIYRVYKFMSRVQPASEKFLRALQMYIIANSRRRNQLRKVLVTLKVVSLKLGPCPVVPMTVVKALEMLLQYYVVVALWH
ncbi:unnamed protein product [Orchesella dallaii]|uniref:Odorant receptor n=1 Tax=Orchesella dallaii TaxID=48710 RepID=A0ABP1S3P8_9HEXA